MRRLTKREQQDAERMHEYHLVRLAEIWAAHPPSMAVTGLGYGTMEALAGVEGLGLGTLEAIAAEHAP